MGKQTKNCFEISLGKYFKSSFYTEKITRIHIDLMSIMIEYVVFRIWKVNDIFILQKFWILTNDQVSIWKKKITANNVCKLNSNFTNPTATIFIWCAPVAVIIFSIAKLVFRSNARKLLLYALYWMPSNCSLNFKRLWVLKIFQLWII